MDTEPTASATPLLTKASMGADGATELAPSLSFVGVPEGEEGEETLCAVR